VKESISCFGEPILFLVLASIFVILFVTILKVLKEASFFRENTAVIVALCVSLLSLIGLSHLVAGGDGFQEVTNNEGRTGGILDFILLPYAALGIAILLLLLLRFIAKLFRSERVKRYSEETKRDRTEGQYPFESASKTSEKSNEKAHIRK